MNKDIEGIVFYLRVRKVKATGIQGSNGFTILKGSQAELEDKKWLAAKYIAKKRASLIEAGVLTKESVCYVFSSDVTFRSSSTAAAVVKGGNANGPREWKTSSGKKLHDFLFPCDSEI